MRINKFKGFGKVETYLKLICKMIHQFSLIYENNI